MWFDEGFHTKGALRRFLYSSMVVVYLGYYWSFVIQSNLTFRDIFNFMEEFEIKFLEVDVLELEKKLLTIGAEKVGEYHYQRALFDYSDLHLNKANSWLRLRTNGNEVTLSFKQRIGVKSHDGSIPDEGMKEIEIEVDDFNKMHQIFMSMGFVIKREVRNRRVTYKKGSTVFDIDFWSEI